jgi:hypothetical protein
MEEIKQKVIELFNSDSLDEKYKIRSEINNLSKGIHLPANFELYISGHIDMYSITGIKTDVNDALIYLKSI